MTRRACLTFTIVLFLAAATGTATAQVFESAGSRALGMGGAFVAVANDSTATWWNPAALPTGPFVDVSIDRASTTGGEATPSWRQRTTGVALLTPPVGLSYYRYSVADVGALSSGQVENGTRVRMLTVNQVGGTFVQSVADGVHLGATVKYLSGHMAEAQMPALPDGADLRDRAGALEAGGWDAAFDLDLGGMVVRGPVRAGLTLRHVTRPAFGKDAGMALPRQARAGVAYDGDAAGHGPYLVSMDLDLSRIETVSGERRNVALGLERWLGAKKVGIRGGARVNTLGGHERTVTAGASLLARPGMYVEGHVALGGSTDDRGWSLGARVTF